MKRLTIISLVLLLFSSSCKKSFTSEDQTVTQESADDMTYVSKVFARALEDKEIRDFIKEEALKKFNNDYDVLYQFVKDNQLNNGETFASALEKYSDNPILFRELLETLPLLTIYVPELEKFSAENWNTIDDIPLVAVRNLDDKKAGKSLFAYNADGTSKALSYYKIPDIPVVVVKSNERVIVSNEEPARTAKLGTTDNKGALVYTKKGGIYFIDNNFDNLQSSESSSKQKLAGNRASLKASTSTYGYPAANGKHQMFFNFLGDPSLNSNFANYVESPKVFLAAYKEYQRDFIYYNINNLTDTGRFDNSYVESIHSISVNQSASEGYIVDDLRDWTDGILEIKVHVSFLNRTGGFESLYKIFSVSATELFKKEQNVNKPRVYYLPEPLKLVGWNVYELGDKWHFFVEEIDPGSEFTKTVSASSTFTNSWEFEGSGGINIGIVKLGASVKGQGSSSTTNSETIVYKTTGGSDDLGTGILEYTDKISLGYKFDVSPWHEAHDIYTINTGMVELGIVPVPKY